MELPVLSQILLPDAKLGLLLDLSFWLIQQSHGGLLIYLGKISASNPSAEIIQWIDLRMVAFVHQQVMTLRVVAD